MLSSPNFGAWLRSKIRLPKSAACVGPLHLAEERRRVVLVRKQQYSVVPWN